MKIPKTLNLDLLKANAVSAMAFARCRRSNLRVGCAVLDTKNTIYTGANVEVLWQRCYHAEETAIIGAMAHDAGEIRAVCIACDRRLFTPCGHCMDVIIEFCKKDGIVMHYNPRTKKESIFSLEDLMPHYPTRD